MNTTYLILLLRAVMGDIACHPDCADIFPPGHKNTGDAWWALGDDASGAFITSLTTTLIVPPKPDGVVGPRLINPGLDSSVSIGLLPLSARRGLQSATSFKTVVGTSTVLILGQNVSDPSDAHVATEEYQVVIVAYPDPASGGQVERRQIRRHLLIRVDSCNATGDQWCVLDSEYRGSTGIGSSTSTAPMTVNPGDALKLACMIECQCLATSPDLLFADWFSWDDGINISYQDMTLGSIAVALVDPRKSRVALFTRSETAR